MAASILLPASAGLIDRVGGRSVTLITPHSGEAVEIQKTLWVEGDPVAEIYGNPIGTMRVLFVDPSALIVPEEDPALVLLPKRGSENPLQGQTVWFLAQIMAAIALAVAAAGGTGILWMRGRRRNP
jgi:hypothetical protein